MTIVFLTQHLLISIISLVFLFFLSSIPPTASAGFYGHPWKLIKNHKPPGFDRLPWKLIKNLSAPIVKDVEKISIDEAKRQHKISQDFKGEIIYGYSSNYDRIADGRLYKLVIEEIAIGNKPEDVYIAVVFVPQHSTHKDLRCFSGPKSDTKCG
ncbi:hypothetical protein L1887_35647 [Cichorium endivia]|nr:hypothetical protein L1887_35647 [Cichorium endivia]